MMNYAPGSDVPRKVHPAGTQPEPPRSYKNHDNDGSRSKNKSRKNLPLHENFGIDYTNFAKSASRRGVGQYFILNEETKIPVPLDVTGFFRVSPVRSSYGSVKVSYRMRNVDCVLWSKELFALEIPKHSERDITHEDILSAALRLCEIRKEEIDRPAEPKKLRAAAPKLFGDYPSLWSLMRGVK